jgi:hypothetical protein
LSPPLDSNSSQSLEWGHKTNKRSIDWPTCSCKQGLDPPERDLADASRLKSAATILSFLLLIFNSYYPFCPMNLEVANEGFHIIISSKGATIPQKLYYLKDGIGR